MVKKGYLPALEHIGPDLIDFYPVDAFVNTACPRIAIDDAVRYRKPLITPFELEVALGKKWETGYMFDEISTWLIEIFLPNQSVCSITVGVSLPML